jgi:hypothetical protein
MQSKSREARSDILEADVITRDPVVTKIMEQPQITKIVEMKNIEILSKPIVKEIHEQPIIEVQKQLVTEHVVQDDIVTHQRAAPQYQEVNLGKEAPQLNLGQGEIKYSKQATVKNVNLNEEVTQVVQRQMIERHVVPTITQIKEQRVISVIDQPIIRTIHEPTIIREVTSGTSQLSQLQQPLLQETTAPTTSKPRASFVPSEQDLLDKKEVLHASKLLATDEFKSELASAKDQIIDSENWQQGNQDWSKEQLHSGVLSTEEFKGELAHGHEYLHEAKPFASEEFREEIQYGQEVLHDAYPFSREGFAEELQAQKLHLEKSRYFSKPVFLPEFMAQKILLKANPACVYSREINEKGEDWKRAHLGIVEKAKLVVEGAVEVVKETFENAKAALLGESLSEPRFM